MAKDEKPEIDENEIPEVEHELSQVATNPKQNMLILVGISLVFLYLLYSLFISSGDQDTKPDEDKIPDEVAKPVQVAIDDDIPSIPSLPSPPRLEDPTPPLPPQTQDTITDVLPPAGESLPPLPTDAPLNTSPVVGASLPFDGIDEEEARKRRDAKRKSSIVLVSGVPPKKTPEQIQQEADFNHRGDMHLLLGRGKVLDAIIETAVNTDFGGEIRAVITKDVYSEWGKNILISKGSRVYGNYATGIDGAYGRISITWTRIDLANGYSLNLSGTGVDGLGRKGNQGRVDNKFREKFSNAVLRSAFNVVLANMLDSITKPPISSQAAASRNATATNIQNIANTISTNNTDYPDATVKRLAICTQTQAAIEDKTSTAFTQIQSACQAAIEAPGTNTPEALLATVLNAISTSGTSLVQNTTAGVEATKAQEASKQAFTDISDTLKEMIESQEFKPTITIEQGTSVKIYVNKDYKFPKAALNVRLMR